MEFSRRDTQYAEQIIERLLGNDEERLSMEIEENLVLSDVEKNVNSFSEELIAAEQLDIGIPIIKISENDGYFIPVSLFSLFPAIVQDSYWWRFDHHLRYEWMHYLLRPFRGRNQLRGFQTIHPNEARGIFFKQAVKFLATRIAAVRSFGEEKRERWGKPASLNLEQTIGGRKVITPGCYFSVSTNSSGLRVFWSGAYYIAPNYFSSPTSPATSVLQAGTYIFGIDGGAYGNAIQWDTNAVASLPGNPFSHLNY